MSKKIALFAFSLSLTLFSVSALAASECAPRLSGSSLEVSEIVPGSEITGESASDEISAARESAAAGAVQATVDLFGRELSLVARIPISATESVTVGAETANARSERYCSEAMGAPAKCATLCTRWSNYERD
jgi:hypothetical protein